MKQTVRAKRGSMCFSRLSDSNLALQHCRELKGWGVVIHRNNDNPRLHRQQKYSVYGERKINPLQRACDSMESGFSLVFLASSCFFPNFPTKSIVDVRVHVCGSCGCLTFTGVHSSVEKNIWNCVLKQASLQC